jgi:hypothetical protein
MGASRNIRRRTGERFEGLVTSKLGIGYKNADGDGGTVTQATDKTTAVTLNKPSGAVTTHAANLAAATVVSFDVNNTLIEATDVVVLSHKSGGTPGSYTLNARAAAGKFTVDIRNNTAGGLAEALVLAFALIKGATS